MKALLSGASGVERPVVVIGGASGFIGKTGREAGMSSEQSDLIEHLCRESLR